MREAGRDCRPRRARIQIRELLVESCVNNLDKSVLYKCNSIRLYAISVGRGLVPDARCGHGGAEVELATDPDVFAFLDYRAYLRAFYRERKQRRRLSYRAFSRRARLRSPNYLKLVIDGERNLSPEMAPRFAEACGLSGEASAYFAELVAFGQASDLETRNRAYAKLSSFRRYRATHRLDKAADAYHSCWYLPAIRELAARRDFRAEPAWIARRLEPNIRASDAERALTTLLELGLLRRDAEGRVRQSEASVTTGPETLSLHVANYHATMMAQATRALDAFPPEERDISSVTLTIGRGGLSELKRMLQRFRRELLAWSELERNPMQVIQVNLQMFPLSNAGGTDDET